MISRSTREVLDMSVKSFFKIRLVNVRNRLRPEEAGQAHFSRFSAATTFRELSTSYGSCGKNEPVPGRERLLNVLPGARRSAVRDNSANPSC